MNRLTTMGRSGIALIALTIALVACSGEEQAEETSTEKPKQEEPQEPHIGYGFVLDSFQVYQDTVRKDWTLSHVLVPYGVSQFYVNQAYEYAKDSMIGLRHIKSNRPFTVLCRPGDSTAMYCIYEENPVDYIVFDFSDSVAVYRGKKKVETVIKESSGTIASSMWNAFIDNGMSPALAANATKVFQWSIDFFMIQKGDWFKVIYEDKYVDGEYIGVGDILAMEFNYYDSSYFAIPFKKDTIDAYFDREGGSLRKALLKAPLNFIRVSSKFSHNRLHPVLGYRRPHYGVDYAAPTGTPVVSVGDGIVIYAGYSGGAGNLVKIKHNDRITTYYMHLHRFGPGIRTGVHVTQGQHIGDVGSTGLSTGPHLDYRIYIDGKPVDPLSADIPAADPLTEPYLEYFYPVRDSVVERLNNIPLNAGIFPGDSSEVLPDAE